jgi:tetratricopeptide (TPR) repeat protein
MTGIVPLCALGAWGFDAVARRGRSLAVILILLLGVWAGTAYTSFWIPARSATTLNWVGLQLQHQNRWSEAQSAFLGAIDVDPHTVPARINQSALLLRVGDRNTARRLIDQVLRDDPDNTDALLGLALILQAEGKNSEARAHLKRLCELAPDFLGAHSIRGALLMTQHEDAEAIAAFRQAVRIDPSSPADHANLGLLLERTGDIEGALAQYQRALDLRPDHAVWLAEKAWVLATQEKNRDPEQALRLAESACQLTDNRDGLCLQALAAAEAACGRYDDAWKTANQASVSAAVAKQAGPLPQLAEQLRCYKNGEPYIAHDALRVTPFAPAPARTVFEWDGSNKRGRSPN